VQFQRLRLQGFKSFVEPTEFRIEPGLTGVVGPNGCGKSNLLEALRWVMGANSAKAMRAGGMDDVIFAGSGNRPARNHADVTLTIDNADRTAPAQFNDDPVLEVVRRIDRGEGSTYRINGREVRARDVQLLFADASTGANSPALVRQGQISELIGAKPQNRRRILEEAAGVSGLHTRRHEAELRLRAAEANLSRLEDVARELETALNRLRREARQAEKYKRLSAEIRAVQGAVLYARWTEARDTLTRTQTEATEAARAVEETARAAAAAQTAILAAETAMPPLREEASIAQAILGQLAIQKDRAERESQAAAAEFERLSADLTRIDDDRARESQGLQDAVQALARADAELTELRAQIAAAPARGPELAAAAQAAEDARAKAEARSSSWRPAPPPRTPGPAPPPSAWPRPRAAWPAPSAPWTRPGPSAPPSGQCSIRPPPRPASASPTPRRVSRQPGRLSRKPRPSAPRPPPPRPSRATWPARSRTSWAACAPRRAVWPS
jgi:chromosome segregation protein